MIVGRLWLSCNTTGAGSGKASITGSVLAASLILFLVSILSSYLDVLAETGG